jgi:hypothetical protein
MRHRSGLIAADGQPPSPSKTRRATVSRRRFVCLTAVIGITFCVTTAIGASYLDADPYASRVAHQSSGMLKVQPRTSAPELLDAARDLRKRVAARGANLSLTARMSALNRTLASQLADPLHTVSSLATLATAAVHRCVPLGGGTTIELAASQVDDDYCDCADASDEPRTAACSGATRNARFTCPNDVHIDGGHTPVTIAASRVLDGVCDCCDGADESPPKPRLAYANRGRTACPNRCAALVAGAAAFERTRQAGARARDALAAKVRSSGKHGSAAVLAAPHPAYAALSGECFRSAAAEYEYSVCLYEKATQAGRGRSHGQFSLGRHWEWRGAAASTRAGSGTGAGAVGVLTGGDVCAGANVKRSLTVRFECTDKDHFLDHVEERSPCAYEVTLHTAAAC